MLTEKDVKNIITRAKAVRNNYLPYEERMCHVCGRVLSLASSGPEGIKYACDYSTTERESGLSLFASERFRHRAESSVWTESSTKPDKQVVNIIDEMIKVLEAL